ncbi:MAG: 16S rRNA (cytosine(1402)-N(4))-methyltransferase RsmH [Polyangiales bacterium]
MRPSAGGHTEAILEASAPNGVVIGVDRDEKALQKAKARLHRFGDRLRPVHGRFGSLPEIVREAGADSVNGLVADLGLSSMQLDDPERGFSFQRSGPIDMRMDQSDGRSAIELIARTSENDLADLIYEFGEERRSRAIARSIKRAEHDDRLETTDDLRRAVVAVLGPKRTKTDPATRTFQALRIAVNEELEELRSLIECLPSVLQNDGVAVIISFHSIEDRIVKHAFRENDDWTPLSKKPVIATEDEIRANPRSRSAKLRAARWGRP